MHGQVGRRAARWTGSQAARQPDSQAAGQPGYEAKEAALWHAGQAVGLKVRTILLTPSLQVLNQDFAKDS